MHPDIALGMERFKYLYRFDVLTRNHFELPNFAAFHPTETNITPKATKYTKHYAQVLAKFGDARVIGDKYPALHKKYPYLWRTFGVDCRFIYIARDVTNVCRSWNERAQNVADRWPAENDYRKAVPHWNDANRRTLAAIKRGIPVLVIRYESMFHSNASIADAVRAAVLSHLDLESHSLLDDAWLEARARYDSLKKRHAQHLPAVQATFITENANMDVYRRLLRGTIGDAVP